MSSAFYLLLALLPIFTTADLATDVQTSIEKSALAMAGGGLLFLKSPLSEAYGNLLPLLEYTESHVWDTQIFDHVEKEVHAAYEKEFRGWDPRLRHMRMFNAPTVSGHLVRDLARLQTLRDSLPEDKEWLLMELEKMMASVTEKENGEHSATQPQSIIGAGLSYVSQMFGSLRIREPANLRKLDISGIFPSSMDTNQGSSVSSSNAIIAAATVNMEKWQVPTDSSDRDFYQKRTDFLQARRFVHFCRQHEVYQVAKKKRLASSLRGSVERGSLISSIPLSTWNSILDIV